MRNVNKKVVEYLEEYKKEHPCEGCTQEFIRREMKLKKKRR